MLDSYLHHHSASQRHNIKDRRMKDNAGTKTQEQRKEEDFFNSYIHLSLYCKGSKGLFKVCM